MKIKKLQMIDSVLIAQKTCKVCNGFGWVCEDHPNHEWDYEHQDNCGPGQPCVCINIEALERVRNKLIALRGKNEKNKLRSNSRKSRKKKVIKKRS